MSLPLIVSDRAEDLLGQLAGRLAAAQRRAAAGPGLPRPIPVLVPSNQLADWLQAELARKLGVCMGFEFLTAAAYLEGLRGGPADPLAGAFAAWKAEALRWRILPHVDAFAAPLGLAAGQDLPPRDRLAFAGLLARQFERYGRHRPEWITAWSGGQPVGFEPPAHAEDEAWQRDLWQRLTADLRGIPHPARVSLPAAETGTEPPAPLFVVGNDLLDPLTLDALARLAAHGTAVECFVLLPTLGYLGDVNRRHACLERARLPEDAVEPDANPLIASLGRRAVGAFLLLSDRLSPDFSAWPEWDEPARGRTELLARLQADIRAQRAPARDNPELSPTDLSLQVHCCHSPRRELEVLRDELLRAFADLPDLQPHEVLVAVTDLDTYAPLVEGVLGAALGPAGASGEGARHRLPVRLTAVPAREANPITVGLLALLRLALGRQAASEVIDLLSLSAVQQHLDVADDAGVRATLAETIRQSGLTHGLGIDPGREDGTWAAAIDRVAAGAWFGPLADARTAAGALVLPLASDLAQDDAAKLRFAGWLQRVARHLSSWTEARPAKAWAERLEHAITDLLASEEHADPAAAARRLLAELREVEAETPLDVGGLLDWLQPKLDNATSLRTSLGGQILVGRIDQIHGLPCRVLAILGLQDGAFPRAARLPAWDLLAHRPEAWDSDPRAQDRQWFLDGVLAPSDRLILTAANRSLRTPHDGPLSSCVEDLLRVAAATVPVSGGADELRKRLVHHHPIQPFADGYFDPATTLPATFNHTAAAIATGLNTRGRTDAAPFFDGQNTGAHAAGPELALEDLIAFWKSPAKGWLRALQVAPGDDEDDDRELDEAPIELDGLQAYAATGAALEAQIRPERGGETKTAGARLQAERGLPPGALGDLAWESTNAAVEPLASSLRTAFTDSTKVPLNVPLADGLQLVGEVRMVPGLPTEPGPHVIDYRPGKYDEKPKYQLGALLRTAAAAVHLGKPVGCRVFGTDSPAGKPIRPISPEKARELLSAFVEGFREGRQRPLCYAPDTSMELAVKLAKSPEAEALAAAREAWEKEPTAFSSAGEGLEPSARLAWRDADAFAGTSAEGHAREWLRWSRAVSQPLTLWWSGGDLSAPMSPPTPPAASPAKKSGRPAAKPAQSQP